MRPKPDRQRCPLAKYSSGGKYVRRQNFIGENYFMGKRDYKPCDLLLTEIKIRFCTRNDPRKAMISAVNIKTNVF